MARNKRKTNNRTQPVEKTQHRKENMQNLATLAKLNTAKANLKRKAENKVTISDDQSDQTQAECQSPSNISTSQEDSSVAFNLESSGLMDALRPEAPKYYLPRIVESLYSKADNCEVSKRYLTHFNLTRKCFDKIIKIESERSAVASDLPRKARKTLILDLDETLVHTFQEPQSFDTEEIELVLNGDLRRTIYVRFRPGCFEFLKEMRRHYEIYVFTASHSAYANPIIDILDPENKLVSKRFFNESCVKVRGYYVKSLGMLGINMKDVIIVDNMALSFGLNVENGVPIVCYKGEEGDKELPDLSSFLKYLNGFDDIRIGIQQYFKWDKFKLFYKSANSLVKFYF